MATRRLTTFEWLCLGVVGVAFALRIPFVLSPHPIWDSAWYLMLSRSWLDHGDFWIRWTDPPEASSYWPPLYPILISPLVRALGDSYRTLMLASVLTTALLCVVTLATTWDLFGRARGFAAMAIVACTPAFITSNLHGMSEATLELTVVLALWAFLKSVREKWWLLAALPLGGLAYLAKPNVGAPLIALAAVPIVAWRVRARGWRRVLRDPLDVGVGIAAVVALLGARLLAGKGVGGIGLDVIQPLHDAVSDPRWILLVLFKLAFASAFLLFATLPFSLRVRQALRVPEREETGYLWIVVALSLVATAIFSASFLLTEHRASLDIRSAADLALLTDFDNVRYLSPAIVPFLWIVLPLWNLDAAGAAREVPPTVEGAPLRRRHVALFASAVVLYTLLLLFSPLAIEDSVTRLVVTILLALVPLGLAFAASRSQYEVVERLTSRGTRAFRIIRKAPSWGLSGGVALVVLATLVAAFFFSTWFLLVTIGVVIASATCLPGARVAAVALVLLCATLPNFASVAPNEQAARDLAHTLPAGTVVGVTEPIVYFAAVAPDTIQLRFLDASANATPPNMDAVLITGNAPGFGDANFTRVQQWRYTHDLYPTLDARVAFEKSVLSQDWRFVDDVGLTLYVRNGTAAAAAFGR